ncbi:MAG: T9SS type A sorting domain-containing protein [Bacteroidia bacterium]
MKKLLPFLVLIFACQFVVGQTLVSAVQIASKNTSQVSSVLGGSGGPYNAVKIYKVKYNTKDPFNNNTVASGAVFVPNMACDSFPVVAYCHGTVLRKTQVPSAQYDSNYEGLYFSSKGFVVAMPDYLGLGDNPGFHPYLHAETEATATLDLMRAMREFLADSTNIDLNGQIFVTGYSQGGHAAMATLKYIEDHNLHTEFNVVAGAPMSGPYSLSTVQPRTVYDSIYAYNAFTPYVVNSYQYVYGNLYTNVSEYYDVPYDTNVPPYMNGSYTFEALNVTLPTNVYTFMNDSVLNAFMADTISYSTPLRQDLKLNDNYSWNASMPLRLCYCGSDDLVLPGNSQVAADSMTAMGSPDVSAVNINPAGDHFTCFSPAMTYVRNWFNTLKVSCTATTGISENEMQQTVNISLYPNPAENEITIESSEEMERIQVTDINGKIVINIESLNKDAANINISAINNGFYFIKSYDKQGRVTVNKFMVQKNK